MRLFHRSTRRLALTEGGERFLRQVGGPLASLQAAVDGARSVDEEPAGALKVSMGQAFGRHFLVPLLADFLAPYPRVLPDWHFDNRRVDIVGEASTPRSAAASRSPRAWSRASWRRCTSSRSRRRRISRGALPRHPDDLAGFDGIMRRSSPTGRVRACTLRARRGVAQPVPCRPRLIFSGPEAIAQTARLGLGVALLPMPFAVAPIASGELVRLLPGWYSDAGPLSLYDPNPRLLPAKIRVFVDFVVERCRFVGFARLVDSRPPDNHQPHADRR